MDLGLNGANGTSSAATDGARDDSTQALTDRLVIVLKRSSDATDTVRDVQVSMDLSEAGERTFLSLKQEIAAWWSGQNGHGGISAGDIRLIYRGRLLIDTQKCDTLLRYAERILDVPEGSKDASRGTCASWRVTLHVAVRTHGQTPTTTRSESSSIPVRVGSSSRADASRIAPASRSGHGHANTDQVTQGEAASRTAAIRRNSAPSTQAPQSPAMPTGPGSMPAPTPTTTASSPLRTSAPAIAPQIVTFNGMAYEAYTIPADTIPILLRHMGPIVLNDHGNAPPGMGEARRQLSNVLAAFQGLSQQIVRYYPYLSHIIKGIFFLWIMGFTDFLFEEGGLFRRSAPAATGQVQQQAGARPQAPQQAGQQQAPPAHQHHQQFVDAQDPNAVGGIPRPPTILTLTIGMRGFAIMAAALGLLAGAIAGQLHGRNAAQRIQVNEAGVRVEPAGGPANEQQDAAARQVRQRRFQMVDSLVAIGLPNQAGGAVPPARTEVGPPAPPSRLAALGARLRQSMLEVSEMITVFLWTLSPEYERARNVIARERQQEQERLAREREAAATAAATAAAAAEAANAAGAADTAAAVETVSAGITD